MCVSCGEPRTKFHSHVLSCVGASRESAGDLLSIENKRAESLRLANFSIEQLKTKYKDAWHIVAHAYVNIGIPIRIGHRLAVSSVDKLQEYLRQEGTFDVDVNGGVSFIPVTVPAPTIEPCYSTTQQVFISAKQVTDTPNSKDSTETNSESTGLPAMPASSGDIVTDASPVRPKVTRKRVIVSSPEYPPDASPVRPKVTRKRVIVSSPEYPPDASPVRLKVTRKRVIVSSPEYPPIPGLPDRSSRLTTRSKSKPVPAPSYNLMEDDDVTDPSYEPPKEVGLKGKLRQTLVDTDSSSSGSDSDTELSNELRGNSRRNTSAKDERGRTTDSVLSVRQRKCIR